MGVAGEISLDSGPLQLHQNIQVFGESSHITHRTFKHKDNHNLKTHHFHTLHNSTFYLSGSLEGSHMIHVR